jgi:serine/threonine-protein kinase RsbW
MSGQQFLPARVRLALTSRPEAGRLVRSTSSAVGAALSFDAELLSDVNTAVSEACNNVVVHAYEHGSGPFSVELAVTLEDVEVQVRDHGRGIQQTAPDRDELKVGLALMGALADRVEFTVPPGGGTAVRLVFRRPAFTVPTPTSVQRQGDSPRGGRRADGRRGEVNSGVDPVAPSALAGRVELGSALSGDVVLTVSPVQLLAPVLGRLGRALAPAAGFSADRCADVYLVTDALGAHAEHAACDASISVALGASDRRMEFALAPLRAGMSSRLKSRESRSPRLPLAWLSDEVAVDHADGYDTLLVQMREHRRNQPDTRRPGRF